MANITVKQRLTFLEKASTLTNDMNTLLVNACNEATDVANKIGVSGINELRNKIARTANAVNADVRDINTQIGEMLEVLAADKYNIGEYTELVKKAISVNEESRPNSVVVSEISLSEDAQEDVSDANVNALTDMLNKLTTSARAITLDLSDVAGKLKSDDTIPMAKGIGSTVEGINNKIIRLSAGLKDSVEEFKRDYKKTLSRLGDLSISCGAKEDISTDSNIKMSV